MTYKRIDEDTIEVTKTSYIKISDYEAQLERVNAKMASAEKKVEIDEKYPQDVKEAIANYNVSIDVSWGQGLEDEKAQVEAKIAELTSLPIKAVTKR